MKNNYITHIKVNKVFHLRDFAVDLGEDCPHLILTGKNGSGKTVLLNAIADALDMIKSDGASAVSEKVELKFSDQDALMKDCSEGNFVRAFYEAKRNIQLDEPKNPTKPTIQPQTALREKVTGQFLNYLVDLKVQRALAQGEGNMEYAAEIEAWFESFETLLKKLYKDDALHLEFDIKTYEFFIHTEGKRFKFTQLSDGYMAILEVIADLILKMQEGDRLTRSYNKKGIVLIDEIETHLHLSLQKDALGILTTLFPRVQFIVTTHSPFVLNAQQGTTAFDLEHREAISNLYEYSYDSLTEGYFEIEEGSSYRMTMLNKLKGLLAQTVLSLEEKEQVRRLCADFDALPELLFPSLVGQYRQLKLENVALIHDICCDD